MKARWTLSLPQTSRANPVQCCSTHLECCSTHLECCSTHQAKDTQKRMSNLTHKFERISHVARICEFREFVNFANSLKICVSNSTCEDTQKHMSNLIHNSEFLRRRTSEFQDLLDYKTFVVRRDENSFFDGYCSTVQGLLDWFEADLGFTNLSFIQIDWFVCSVCFCC